MKQIDYVGLPYIVKDFLVYMDVIKNKSNLTIEEYSSDLRLFLKFLKMYKGLVPSSVEFNEIDITDIDEAFIKDITLNDAYAFLSYCKNERDNHEAARARKVSSIRAFFKYLSMQKQILDENPMQVLDSPKLKKALPKYLTLEECLKLLKNIDGKNKERDYCIFVFFLNCGLRLSELVGLNYNDIRDNHTMKVTGKGNKERTIYLNDASRKVLQEYLYTRLDPRYISTGDNAFFLSTRQTRISPKTVQFVVYKYLRLAGYASKGLSVHKLRHTAATLMFQSGNVDIRVLKDILGHEQLNTTQIYTHVVDKNMQEAMRQNPLSNISIQRREDEE